MDTVNKNKNKDIKKNTTNNKVDNNKKKIDKTTFENKTFKVIKPLVRNNFKGGKNSKNFSDKTKNFKKNENNKFRKSYGKRRDNNQFDQNREILYTRKICAVKKDSKKLSFSVLVCVGDQKGKVGIGLGKHKTKFGAIIKATTIANANMISVPLKDKLRTIEFDAKEKFRSTQVIVKSARNGVGIKAGVTASKIFYLLGVSDVNCKVHNSSNALNVAYCIFQAFYFMQRKLSNKNFLHKIYENEKNFAKINQNNK